MKSEFIEKITSPEISVEKNFIVSGNYFFSLILKNNIVELCFPLCENSSLFCFKIYDLLKEKDFEQGWIKNSFENDKIKLIIPPYRSGMYIGKIKMDVKKIEAYSKIFWEIRRDVKSLRTPWSIYPVYYSETGNILPSIAFIKEDNGLYISIGDTPDRAVLNGIYLSRIGKENLDEETKNYMERFDEFNKPILNNILLSLFFSNSICIDKNENCILASKSPKYYVSGGFWARDFIFWILPVIEKFDPERSKELIEIVLKKYWKNKGTHALYIDGRILYEGFELDQFAYYFILLERALKYKIINQNEALSYANELVQLLRTKKAKNYFLYSTELNSSDDPVRYEYVTYDNIILWYSIKKLLKRLKNSTIKEELNHITKNIKSDIMKKMVKNGKFVYSTDLKNHYEFYDDPTGSLILLPYLGFIRRDDNIYKNTLKWITSDENPFFIQGKFSGGGNRHVKHPWVHYYSNLIFSGLLDKKIIEEIPFDSGLMCETIDEKNGICLTGIHFPGSSGFFVQSILDKNRI